jgi:hypothetical protein
MHSINCRDILGRWRISVLGIFLSGGFLMVAPVGVGTSGRGFGIGGLWIGK